jgi:Transcription elongation factor, N-terminal
VLSARAPSRPNDDVLMTQEGYDRLRRELLELTTTMRRELAERLSAARDGGSNPAENGDLMDALQNSALLEQRIGELEGRLAAARIAPPAGSDGVAAIGTRVGLRTGVMARSCTTSWWAQARQIPRVGGSRSRHPSARRSRAVGPATRSPSRRRGAAFASTSSRSSRSRPTRRRRRNERAYPGNRPRGGVCRAAVAPALPRSTVAGARRGDRLRASAPSTPATSPRPRRAP